MSGLLAGFIVRGTCNPSTRLRQQGVNAQAEGKHEFGACRDHSAGGEVLTCGRKGKLVVKRCCLVLC